MSEFQEMRRSNWGELPSVSSLWDLSQLKTDWLCFCEILSLVSPWIYSESTRFVMPSSECGGRVEVKSDQGWISVCEDGFDSEAKTVACRELGCGPPQSPLRSLNSGRGTALSKQFRCKGNELRLEDCDSSVRSDCKTAASVRCGMYKICWIYFFTAYWTTLLSQGQGDFIYTLK